MSWSEAAEKVIKKVDSLEEELIELACNGTNIASPPGYEKEVCEFLADWMNERGIDAYVQEFEETRGNVVGVLPGKSGGKSITFNAHMDTTHTGNKEEDLRILGDPSKFTPAKAVVKDGYIHGLGVVNDKGPFYSACIAALALKLTGIELQGDMVLAGVAGEIGVGQIAGHKGPNTRGKGIGTYELLHRGVWTDYAVVCEGSNFSVSWALPGAAYFRITTRGEPTYSPRNERYAPSIKENKNAIVKMAALIPILEEWADKYEEESKYETPCGVIEPVVTIGAIDGGNPRKVNWRPGISNVYMDVRVPPNKTPLDVKRDLEQTVRETGLSDEVHMYLARRGFVAENVDSIVESVTTAHRYVFNGAPNSPRRFDLNMWNDSNIYAEHGIPAIKYGPDSTAELINPERMPIASLMQAARVYALTALRICGGYSN